MEEGTRIRAKSPDFRESVHTECSARQIMVFIHLFVHANLLSAVVII